ncbi:MAG: hypothetical protein KA243_02145 [Candidatus Aminicenantes bacterium]|nr:hypothetical protein [Candidatus Aminicenantes bacterium]NLH77872.1 hypothetical protein [Acidobacteriota bacterium]
MKPARAAFALPFLSFALSLLLPILIYAQIPQAMCRETLEVWVRDKSLNARWNSDRTAVIMVRGGVEYVCSCPDQNRPPACKPAAPAAVKTKVSPAGGKPGPRPDRPARPSAPDFEKEKRELLRELEVLGRFEPVPGDSVPAIVASIGAHPPAVRARVETAARELASGAPAVKEGILRDIEGTIGPRGADAPAVVRSFKLKAGQVAPLAKRFDDLRVGDVLLVRQPDDMTSLDFYKAGWIIILDKALTWSLRPRASHTFLFVKEVDGVKLFLDNMPGQGTRVKTEAQIEAEYAGLKMDVARPISAFDADLLWKAARETGIKSLKEFAARGDNWIDTTDYGPYGDNDMVCSETVRWALVRAGMAIPGTSSRIKKFVADVTYGPSDFYVDSTNFLIVPLERLGERNGGRP